MDIDVMGKHIGSLLAFKDKIEAMLAGAPATAGRSAPSDLDELMSFKREFETAIPDLRKAIADVAVVVDDLGKIKADLAPVLAWVAEQQKAAEAAKAAEVQKATDASAAAAAAKAAADAPKIDEAPQGEQAPTEHPAS